MYYENINKFAISIIKIGNKLLNLLAKAFRNFFHYQCYFFKTMILLHKFHYHLNPLRMGGQKGPPFQFFPCNFFKCRN